MKIEKTIGALLFIAIAAASFVAQATKMDTLELTTPTALASLGAPANGTVRFCSDCTAGVNPCVGSGSGAVARRENGQWNCGVTMACASLINAAASCSTDATNASNISSGTLPAGRLPAFSGDATSSAGSSALTLNTVNSNVGTFNNVTINGKGLATAGSNVAYLTGNQTITLSGDTTGSGTTDIVTTLQTVTTDVGTFGSATQVPQVTLNGKGLVTAASNVPIAIAESQVTGLVSDLSLKAPLASPSFTGNPLAPTASPGDNDTSIATTAFVTAANTATAATLQPLDATLTALAAQNWAANAVPIGTGADTLSQTSFAANTFPARSSSGNLVAKTITDYGLSLIDDADVATAWQDLALDQATKASMPGLLKWYAALAKVHNRTGRARLCVIGASGANGTGAGDSGSPLTANAWPRSWPNRLAELLSGSSAISDAYAGPQGQSTLALFEAIDTRVAHSGSWATTVTVASPGGFGIASGTSTGTFSLTPRAPFDKIEVRSIQFSGGATDVNVDGGSSLGTVTSAGGLSAAVQTFTVPLGNHTINFVHTSPAATTYITHIIPYNSTAPGIDIVQAGVSGATVASFTTNTSVATVVQSITGMACDLHILQFGANDIAGATGASTFGTNLTTLATALSAVGSVMFMTDAPQNTTNWTDGTSATYFAQMKAVAIANNAPMLRLGGTTEPSRWNTYALANAVMPYGDTLHPGATGYWDEALAVANAVAPGQARFGTGAEIGVYGTRTLQQNIISRDYTFVLNDSGKQVFHPAADTTSRIWTVPANASVAFPIGTVLTLINEGSAGSLSIPITSDTMVLCGAGTTGTRTLAANGQATLTKVTATKWTACGSGLTANDDFWDLFENVA